MIFRWRSILITWSGFVMISMQSLSILSCTQNNNPIESDYSYIIAHWDFNDKTGEVLTDVSGNGHDGIIHAPVWGNGVRGALRFSDGLTWVTIPYSESLQPKEELTIESILKFDRQTFMGGEPIITNNFNGGFGLWSWMGILNIWINIDGAFQTAFYDHEYSTSQWYHLAATYDGIRLRFYLNNELTNELAVEGPIEYSVHNAIQIGREASHSDAVYGNKFFDGLIDEIRISNRSLEPEEFLQIDS
ncbi:MAG TPA: LamG domain-containing protein [Candidatus Marinimicrobia bacterium]|nr:LamG domain-containing protein [Candidatus Neomarinimicrobiota bacterium]HIB32699.1 LamG domain-containing protein [Candidatus Neomarinimicrobiota bacterium]